MKLTLLNSTPNQFGLYPSEFNYVGPGKRPLSSITPTIIEKDNKLEIVIGGSGGSMIPTATLNVSDLTSCRKEIL